MKKINIGIFTYFGLPKISVISRSMILMSLFLGKMAFSQSPNDIIPTMPSPTVASLAKYVDFPDIDKYGSAPFAIPIYTIKVKNFTLPITLKYKASGIRVSQESTWVGLGFDLDGLGFITRSVRDLPDDMDVQRVLSVYSENFQYHGWLVDPDYYENFPNLPWAQGSDDETKSASVLSVNDGSAFTNGRQDKEPDIFYLKIGSIDEKFIFDHDGNIVFLEPNSKLKVTYVLNDLTKGIREFTVTDDLGNIYYFGSTDESNAEVEETTVNTSYSGNLTPYPWNYSVNWKWWDGGTESRTFRTTWFVREIKVQDNNESINFAYQSATEDFDVPLDQYYTKQDNNSDPENPKPLLYYLWSGLKSIHHTTNTKYLSAISTSNLSVDFTLSDRIDLQGAKKLDKISVTSNSNLVEECTLYYANLQSAGQGTLYDLNRLYLEHMYLLGKPPYDFYYTDRINMPDKKSYKQDFWGFPCFKSTAFIPKLYVYPAKSDHLRYSCYPIVGDNNYIELDGSDRSIDNTSILTGSLERVGLPTGGYQEFELEPNDFYDENWGEIQGGGLRLKESRKLDENLNLLLKKDYTYTEDGTSSGILLSGLSFAVPTSYSIPSADAITYGTMVNDPDVWDYFTLRTSSNYFPLVNHDGALVAYTNVSIIETGNGKIEKEFYPEKNYLTNATEVKWAGPITEPGLMLGGDTDYYKDLNNTLYVNLKNYITNGPDSTILVPLYEHVDGSGWTPTGTQVPDYYFYYDNDFVFYSNTYNNSHIIIDNSVDEDIDMGTVQKYGYNIYPFPPISDDGKINAGKLKEIRYYAEEDFSNPIKKISYTYKLVGSSVTVYGLSSATDFVCNIRLTPLPLEKDWTEDYNWNVQDFVSNNWQIYIMPKSWAMYKFIANVSYLTKAETTIASGVTTTINYSYNDNLLINQETQNESDGTSRITKYKFADDYNYVNSTNPINAMVDRNIVGKYIEKEVSKDDGSQTKIISAEVNEFNIDNNLIELGGISTYKPNVEDYSPMNSTIDGNGVFHRDSRYIPEMTFDHYDDNGNLLQYTDRKGMPYDPDDEGMSTSVIWAYNNLLPVAAVTNATDETIFYTSFEEDTQNTSTDARTGLLSHSGTFSIPMPAITGDYIITYWEKPAGGSWTYHEINQNVATANDPDVIISATGSLVDEVRLYPKGAQMTTYTYDPFIGITSKTDPNNVTTYFEYDEFGRLEKVKDNDTNIINTYIYNYFRNQE